MNEENMNTDKNALAKSKPVSISQASNEINESNYKELEIDALAADTTKSQLPFNNAEDTLRDETAIPEQTVYQIFCEEIIMLKWRVLALTCFLTFGSYYIYDFPATIGIGPDHTIGSIFNDKHKTYSITMNLSLYSAYSYPNTVLAIFGGILIDKYIGLRKSMCLFTLLVFLGSVLFWLGVVMINYPILLISRIVFGLGGESLSVAQSAFIARWFIGKRGMALAFGITICFSRIGSFFTFLLSSKFAVIWSVQATCITGIIACLISFITCIALLFLDIYGVKKGIIHEELSANNETAPKFRDLIRLPCELWFIIAICVACYCSVFPFMGYGVNFFIVKYNITNDSANNIMSIYQFCSAGMSPLIGFLVDKLGRYTWWLSLASVGFALIHLVLISTDCPPYIIMIIMGVFYAFLVSGLWPSVPYCVPENIVAFSYGVITAMQNLGLATFPLILGAILKHYTPVVPSGEKQPLPEIKGFIFAEILLMCSAFVSLLLSICLFMVDRAYSGFLNASPRKRQALIESKIAKHAEFNQEIV